MLGQIFFFSERICLKKRKERKVGEPGRQRGDDDDDFKKKRQKRKKRKSSISQISCASTVTFLHTAYCPLYTSQEQVLSFHSCSSSRSLMSSHVPWSKVSGSLVQMFFFSSSVLLLLLRRFHNLHC